VPSESFTIEQALTLLAETPPRLAALTDGLAPAQSCAARGPDAWSAHDALAHLRSCVDVWGDSMRRMLAEDRPTIRAIPPRTWINKTNYLELEFAPSLRAFRVCLTNHHASQRTMEAMTTSARYVSARFS
jgi:hypothetical protein